MGAAGSVEIPAGREMRAEQAFDLVDSSGLGSIDAKELIAGFKALGEEKFEAALHARDIIKSMDESDKDKMIQKSEYMAFLKAKLEDVGPEAAEATVVTFEELGQAALQSRKAAEEQKAQNAYVASLEAGELPGDSSPNVDNPAPAEAPTAEASATETPAAEASATET